jgi:hypothetical protein
VLDADRFATGPSIRIKDDLSQVTFAIESDNPAEHKTKLRLSGLAAGKYAVRNGEGATLATFDASTAPAVASETIVEISVPAGDHTKLFTIVRTPPSAP